MLRVTIWDNEFEELIPLDVDYVSNITGNTYGPPAVVSPAKNDSRSDVRARKGQVVAYINPDKVAIYTIEVLD